MVTKTQPVVKKVVKKTVAKTEPVVKSKAKLVSLEGLTGLALHRAKMANAKASGKALPAKAKATGARTRVALPVFKAPAEFKPHFLEVFVKTEKDGLLGGQIKAIRYQGRYDPQAEDKKKRDLASYDQPTLQGILARLAGVTYATNAAKRLPSSKAFRVVMRINKKAKDGSLSVGIKTIAMHQKSLKTGRVTYKELERTDPAFRQIRKSSRLLPSAFQNVLMPPKIVRGKRVADEADED